MHFLKKVFELTNEFKIFWLEITNLKWNLTIFDKKNDKSDFGQMAHLELKMPIWDRKLKLKIFGIQNVFLQNAIFRYRIYFTN